MEESWIDIREQPPEREGRYRVKTRSSVMIRYFTEGKFYSSSGFNRERKKPLKITHWMHLPEDKTA